MFGRLELSRSDGDLVREYEEKVAIYNALVQVAQKYGDYCGGKRDNLRIFCWLYRSLRKEKARNGETQNLVLAHLAHIQD